jgi:hypothetical protein
MPDYLRVLVIAVVCVGVLWGMVALLRQAKSGSKAVRAAGMMMALFGWGNMRDPRNDTVAEARDGRVRKGNESGDPPDTPGPDAP